MPSLGQSERRPQSSATCSHNNGVVLVINDRVSRRNGTLSHGSSSRRFRCGEGGGARCREYYCRYNKKGEGSVKFETPEQSSSQRRLQRRSIVGSIGGVEWVTIQLDRG